MNNVFDGRIGRPVVKKIKTIFGLFCRGKPSEKQNENVRDTNIEQCLK